MDHSVFSLVYKTHIHSLYSYGVSLGYTPEACMDAIHDVFCKLYAMDEWSRIKNIRFYLLRSLKNRLMDIQKSQKKEINHGNISDLPFTIEVSVMDELIDKEEQELIRNKVESLLNLLTDRQREAIYLRYMQEMDYDEIGTLLNMNAESVRKLVYRGIDKLRQEMDVDLLVLMLFTLKSFLKL